MFQSDLHKFTTGTGTTIIVPIDVAVPVTINGLDPLCLSLAIKARVDNTENVRVGFSDVTPAANGFELVPGQTISIDIDSATKVFVVDTTASGTQIVDVLREI